MTLLGIILLLLGMALVVAEAHVPGGLLGALGAVTLIAGMVVLTAGGGLEAAIAIPVGAGLGLAAGAWSVLAARSVRRTRRARLRSGAEGLPGRVGVVRRWSEPDGQVYIEGALWRARHSWGTDLGDEQEPLHEGDPVVVERVAGLTLCVRRAEDWELIT